MKNTLAENMLRFGIKNLNESEVEKLQGLIKEDSSSRQAFIARLAKIDPKAAEVVENQTAGVTVSNKYVLNYVPGGEDQNDGGGDLYIHRVGASGGMPYIYLLGNAIDKAGPSSGPDDIYIESAGFNIKDYPGGFNEVWNSLDNRTTQDVINGAFQFIQTNLTEFKEAYHEFTRSENNIKRFWNDTPQTFDRSQYGLWMKTNTGNALNVIKIVQDDKLMDNIKFKIENPRSNGKYPELTIPPAV